MWCGVYVLFALVASSYHTLSLFFNSICCFKQSAKTTGERITVTILMILGGAMFAYVVGSICSLFNALDADNMRYGPVVSLSTD